MADDIPMNPHQEIGTHAKADQLSYGKGPPDQIHVAAQGEQPRHGQQHAELSGNGHQHAVYTVSQRLKDTAYHDTVPCKAEAQAYGAQGRNPYHQKL